MEELLQQIVQYDDKEYVLKDVLFILLINWQDTVYDRDVLVDTIADNTPLTSEQAVDWVVELRAVNILEWLDTDVGKQHKEDIDDLIQYLYTLE